MKAKKLKKERSRANLTTISNAEGPVRKFQDSYSHFIYTIEMLIHEQRYTSKSPFEYYCFTLQQVKDSIKAVKAVFREYDMEDDLDITYYYIPSKQMYKVGVETSLTAPDYEIKKRDYYYVADLESMALAIFHKKSPEEQRAICESVGLGYCGVYALFNRFLQGEDEATIYSKTYLAFKQLGVKVDCRLKSYV